MGVVDRCQCRKEESAVGSKERMGAEPAKKTQEIGLGNLAQRQRCFWGHLYVQIGPAAEGRLARREQWAWQLHRAAAAAQGAPCSLCASGPSWVRVETQARPDPIFSPVLCLLIQVLPE